MNPEQREVLSEVLAEVLAENKHKYIPWRMKYKIK